MNLSAYALNLTIAFGICFSNIQMLQAQESPEFLLPKNISCSLALDLSGERAEYLNRAVYMLLGELGRTDRLNRKIEVVSYRENPLQDSAIDDEVYGGEIIITFKVISRNRRTYLMYDVVFDSLGERPPVIAPFESYHR